MFVSPTKPPAKNSNICLSETAYQHKGTRKKCRETNQAAIIKWQRQCLMHKPHRKPWPKSKTSDIYKQMKVKNDHRSKFSKRRSLKKNQGFNGIWTRDLCVTGALLYQLSYEATHWEQGYLLRLLLSNCLNWKIYCNDHSSLSTTL